MPKPIPASASSAITAATRRAGSDHSDGGSGEGSEGMRRGVLRTPRLPRRGPVNWLTDQSINGSRRPAGSATARETTMNFALNDEQLAFKQRCREFARDVIRPAAPVHDADESVPWEVMRAAREQGLSGLEVMQYTASDADGQLGLIYAEEMHWGCAGIALAINGSGLAAAGVAASGTPEQIAEWVPRVPRRRRRDQARRLRGDRAAGGLRRQEPADDGAPRRRRVGPERHQGLHHQRRHRRRQRRRRHRRPEPRPSRPGLVRRPQGHARPADGQEGDASSASAPRRRQSSSSRTAGSRSSTCSAASTSSSASSSAPAPARAAAALRTRSRPSS